MATFFMVVACGQLNAFHAAVETVSTQTRSASEAAMSVASPELSPDDGGTQTDNIAVPVRLK
jgi:hypothetical protein